MRSSISLLTDFGTKDSFVGQMKGVILNINPEVNIVDLSHDITPFNIGEAALMIEKCHKYFPLGTIHVAVVDPGVGSKRRPIIVMNGDYFFVGPDNGVFSSVMESSEKVEVIHVTNNEFFLRKGSMTFQGRDVFAPVAAWLSKGETAFNFGKKIRDYHVLEMPVPTCDKDTARGEVISVDRFGNAVTNISLDCIERFITGRPINSLTVRIHDESIQVKRFYEEGRGEGLCALINSDAMLELFLYQGNASQTYRIGCGDLVSVMMS